MPLGTRDPIWMQTWNKNGKDHRVKKPHHFKVHTVSFLNHVPAPPYLTNFFPPVQMMQFLQKEGKRVKGFQT
jgi:hypothetical protein